MVWDYLNHLIDTWNGEVVIMGDFNEVRTKEERFGSCCNVQGATAFNSFISKGGLADIPLEGYEFTWSHSSATKTSSGNMVFENFNAEMKCGVLDVEVRRT
ncbi:RNA-directed DNA polymerase, eukaryota [Tanacetum coccineum]|uniref:RNA-directed DNA polymerase, eukaryota n=1 Tax=Tanacetum coccineum TaxID=301880 RepID=A0ABQ4X8B8_9ASTR